MGWVGLVGSKKVTDKFFRSNESSGQKTGSSSSLTSGSKIGDLVRAGVGRDGLDSPGHDKSSGVSSYNSEAGGVKGTMIDQAQVMTLIFDPLYLRYTRSSPDIPRYPQIEPPDLETYEIRGTLVILARGHFTRIGVKGGLIFDSY